MDTTRSENGSLKVEIRSRVYVWACGDVCVGGGGGGYVRVCEHVGNLNFFWIYSFTRKKIYLHRLTRTLSYANIRLALTTDNTKTKQKNNTQKTLKKPSPIQPHTHAHQHPLPSTPSNNIQDIFTNFNVEMLFNVISLKWGGENSVLIRRLNKKSSGCKLILTLLRWKALYWNSTNYFCCYQKNNDENVFLISWRF